MLLRRFAITSAVLLGAAVVSSPAFADTVNLSGSVADTSTVTSTATPGASALSLGGEGTAAADTVAQVADLALESNSSDGVTLTAAADGLLTNGTDSLAYQVLIVADGAAAPVATDFSADNDSKNVTDFTSGAAARDLYIEYDAPDLLDPGTYTSSITVTVTDN
ncbi:uncharacterized protein XM38_022940 [Halomicronema hongdechloris C2206]|uniref:Spore coat protein U domain-containing protein n=1 Tax=Halomicronema hongdechloris C2206 TaxID=1641165 RepID=A0A1Z3HLZ6_9CYAN|nr:hypothetical protein [Halomicronema hongdechloris]ASC71342.1 uncharacterized protein XM38_022940 [Halomicronema hongdechloris C2206]